MVILAIVAVVMLGGCIGEEKPPPAKPDCYGIVTKYVTEDNGIELSLSCTGNCPQEQECIKRSSTDHHGSVREWCGCTDTEDTVSAKSCHIVLYTPGEGVGGGEQSYFCAGSCPDGEECKIKETGRAESEGITVIQYKCACTPN